MNEGRGGICNITFEASVDKDMSDQDMLDYMIKMIRENISKQGLTKGFVSAGDIQNFTYWRDVPFCDYISSLGPEHKAKLRRFEAFWAKQYPQVNLKMYMCGFEVWWDHPRHTNN